MCGRNVPSGTGLVHLMTDPVYVKATKCSIEKERKELEQIQKESFITTCLPDKDNREAIKHQERVLKYKGSKNILELLKGRPESSTKRKVEALFTHDTRASDRDKLKRKKTAHEFETIETIVSEPKKDTLDVASLLSNIGTYLEQQDNELYDRDGEIVMKNFLTILRHIV
jgi:hypothetical protein